MKKFKFRLERVLQYRETIRKEKQRELIQRQQALFEACELLKELERRAREDALIGKNEVAIAELMLEGKYRDWLKSAIDNQRVTISQLEKFVAEAMTEYLEATKEYKTLEKVKERRKSEYLDYIDKEMAKFLDEINTQRAARSRN